MISLSARPQAAATSARREARLLVLDRDGVSPILANLKDLPQFLSKGDVLVVNDAATLPASMHGYLERSGEPIELRLLMPLDPGPTFSATWQVVLFGPGDWRTPTEDRALPPRVILGDRLVLDRGLIATVEKRSQDSPRLLHVRFHTQDLPLLHRFYQAGEPVQYAYHRQALQLWEHQTLFASNPVALEPPSAVMHLSWRDVFALKDKGVEIVSLTHATGISSTGDPWIDAQLPFPERFIIPTGTAIAVNRAHAEGRRVIAAGTGVTRALESAAREDGDKIVVKVQDGVTTLKIGPGHRLKVVTGILTGMHETDTSHMRLIGRFVEDEALRRGYERALRDGFLWHEFGDSCLIL